MVLYGHQLIHAVDIDKSNKYKNPQQTLFEILIKDDHYFSN